MYPFNIKKDNSGEYTFELGEISIKVFGFTKSTGLHKIINPERAYAQFYIRGNVYGVSNNINCFPTVEKFYENMLAQLNIVKNSGQNLFAV
jgi:hypothetical protein